MLIALTIPSGLVVGGVEPAWALFAVPLALAVPLGGVLGLLIAAACAGSVVAVLSGTPNTDGGPMALGIGAFIAIGVIVGLGQAAHDATIQRSRHVSLGDRLTDLHNDEFFFEGLARECARAARYDAPFALAVIDIDRFSDFNRRYGAGVGDHMISAIGRTVRQVARPCDNAARLDGAQFGVIIPGPENDAQVLAEQIVLAVTHIRVPASRGRIAQTTVSVGVASYAPDDDALGTALLDRAERALDEAKAGGRNRVTVYSPEVDRWSSVA